MDLLRIAHHTLILGGLLLAAGMPGVDLASAQQTTPAPAPALQYNPTQPEPQPNLAVQHDPVLSPEAAGNTPQPVGTALQKQGNTNTYVLRKNVDEVLLRCAVVDDKGRLVRTLTKANFQVQEDGVPQTINYIDHSDQPASIGILVDSSGSMLGKHAAAVQAALQFMEASNRKDTAFIVNFSDRAYLDQGFTASLADLRLGLNSFDSHGYTALYDAIAVSADELANHGKWPAQALLIITDGADDASRLSLQQAIRSVQRLGGPVVYAIGLLYDSPNPEEVSTASDALKELCAETGGIAYFPRSLSDVDSIARSVAEDIRNEYVIGYNPQQNNAPGFRSVHVEAEASGYGRLQVRTTKGYYPKPAPALTPAAAQPATPPLPSQSPS